LYKTEWKFKHKIGGERGKTYNGSKFWFQLAICLSTGTFAVFAVVSWLDTVMKSFLFRKRYFLMAGTLTARRTKQKIKNDRGIKDLELLRTNL
jgi:hypothetical protein